MWRRALFNSLKVAVVGTSISFTSGIIFSQEQLYAWVKLNRYLGMEQFWLTWNW